MEINVDKVVINSFTLQQFQVQHLFASRDAAKVFQTRVSGGVGGWVKIPKNILQLQKIKMSKIMF